jgi:hypothetical protein
VAFATSRTVAQDRDTAPAEPPPASEETEQTPPAPDQNPDAEPDSDSAPHEGFIPTEEILADEEVTFPIDI